jgi:hypothetical protein
MRHAVAVRLAYLISWRGGRLTGPFKKMAAQTRTWASMGHEVALFVTTSPAAAPDWLGLGLPGRVQPAGDGITGGIAARRVVYSALRRWEPDLVYLRHGIYTPGLRRVVRRFPTVLEVNGDEVAVARQQSRAKAAWAAMTRSAVLSSARGAVFMSNELAGDPRLDRYPLARIVIPNGVDLAATPSLPPSTSSAPRLVLLGHPDSPWHGTDKLPALARRHPTWSFDVIGPTVADLGERPPSNLTLHAELTTADYLPLLAQADVGLGTLAMHRLGANENPALKVREYLALGLAVIVGCRDPDFPTRAPCLLELPNAPDNVDANDAAITEFVNRWHGHRVRREDIAHLDITRKEQERLTFLARFASAGSRPATMNR